MGPKAKKATTTKKKGATKSKAAAKPVKYTPIKTIKVKENTVFVRTFEDIASIYEEENDKRYFYYRKIAKQLSETDEAITEPTYHVEGVDMVGEKLHDTLEKIIETGTLPKIAEHKKLQSEKDSPMEELTEEFIETIGKQVQKIFEGFFSSCLDWTGGDDSLEYHMKLKDLTGFSATNCDDGSETLVVQRVDKVPFSVTLKQRLSPYIVKAVNNIVNAANEWTILTSYTQRPVSKHFVDNIKVWLEPTVMKDYSKFFLYPTKETSDNQFVIIEGAIGCQRKPGSDLPGRWYHKTLDRSKDSSDRRYKEFQDEVKYWKTEGLSLTKKGKYSKTLLTTLPETQIF